MLAYADRVTTPVPGYGLAVAQAQHALRELVDVLNAPGGEAHVAISPVAVNALADNANVLVEAQAP